MVAIFIIMYHAMSHYCSLLLPSYHEPSNNIVNLIVTYAFLHISFLNFIIYTLLTNMSLWSMSPLYSVCHNVVPAIMICCVTPLYHFTPPIGFTVSLFPMSSLFQCLTLSLFLMSSITPVSLRYIILSSPITLSPQCFSDRAYWYLFYRPVQ